MKIIYLHKMLSKLEKIYRCFSIKYMENIMNSEKSSYQQEKI